MIRLDIENYKRLIPLIQNADMNTLFALSVLEGKVGGEVYVDDLATPNSFYILHSYGMALLYGVTDKEEFYLQLKAHMLNMDNTRNANEWLQVFPPSLYSKMDTILEGHLKKMKQNEPYEPSYLPEDKKILEYQRINFAFHKDQFIEFKKSLVNENCRVVTTSEDIFNQLEGSVIPKYFWKDSREFMNNGIGYTLLLENDFPASTAFSSYLIGDKLEIGIETHSKHHGMGFASYVCAKLIDDCLEHGYEPVWSCNSGNIGSRKLADKLGFEEVKRVPYYRLPI
jgi:RimJ/RimL family protein N-acetyltransferase